MISQDYLPLTEYASKYRVSVSTLRRKIKADEVPFEFKEGKYFLLDRPVSTHQRSVSPSLKQTAKPALVSAQKNSNGRVPTDSGPSEETEEVPTKENRDEPILTTANLLLTELKKAYTQILQEKEDQILHLREELSDLRTLVRVLEEENERLKKPDRYVQS